MSWFKNAQNKQSDNLLINQIKQSSLNLELDQKDLAQADEQWGHNFTLYDVQRYVMDSYGVRVALTRTPVDIKVSILINHNFLGTIAYDDYWSLNSDEMNEAKELYKTLCKIIKETSDEFIAERKPTSIFWPILRSKIEKLNLNQKTHTNVPYVNYSRDLSIEPDWRSNIYGPRYPDYKEQSHDQFYGGRVGKQT